MRVKFWRIAARRFGPQRSPVQLSAKKKYLDWRTKNQSFMLFGKDGSQEFTLRGMLAKSRSADSQVPSTNRLIR